jgi:hypothetical protein
LMNTSVALEQWEEIGHAKDVVVGKKFTIRVGTEYELIATDKVTLRAGKSSLVMDKDGIIQLTGEKITFVGHEFIHLNP